MAVPRFTIVLPTHNRADVIGFAIRSAMAQTFTDFELLVVGDGCTDTTAEVVRGFEDPRIVWLDLPKAPGFGYANRNAAIRQARGELIAYLSHDDLWLADHLATIDAAMSDEKIELAYSLLLLVSENGIVTAKVENLHDPRTLSRLRRMRGGIGISSVAHRRSALDRAGWWSEVLARGGDTDLWVRIIDSSERRNFAYVPVPTALHFIASWRRPSWRARMLLVAYEIEGSLPAELRLTIPDGVREQEAIWQWLSSAPDRHTRRLRRAVQVHLDRLALAPYPSNLFTYLYNVYRGL